MARRHWAARDFWVEVADAIMVGDIPLELAIRLAGTEARQLWSLLGLAAGQSGLPDGLEALIAVTKMLPRRAIPLIAEINGVPGHPGDLEKEVYWATSAEPTEARPAWLHGISDIDVRERLLIRRMKALGAPTAADVLEAAAMSAEDVEQMVATWPR
jgi:hypothetical protein